MTRRNVMLGVGVVAIAALALVTENASRAAAQDEAAAQQAPAEKPMPKRAAPRGRLPAYYAQVVTPQQREQIYAVQQRYAAQLALLQEQIAAIEAQQDKDVEAVLTPEQRTKVAELRTAAAAQKKQPKQPQKQPVDE